MNIPIHTLYDYVCTTTRLQWITCTCVVLTCNKHMLIIFYCYVGTGGGDWLFVDGTAYGACTGRLHSVRDDSIGLTTCHICTIQLYT